MIQIPRLHWQTYRVRKHISSAIGTYRKSPEGFISLQFSVKENCKGLGSSEEKEEKIVDIFAVRIRYNLARSVTIYLALLGAI